MKRGRSGKVKTDAGGGKTAEDPVALQPCPIPRPVTPSVFAGLARALWPAALLIFLAVIIFYLPALRGGFIWDDDDYVTQNLALRTLSGLGQIWFKLGATPQYYPLVFSSFWIEFHLWGLQPLGYHLVNALLHAGSAVLLWLTLRRLGVRGAWLAGLLFAVHPVAAESVAWITERKNVLSTFFYLLSFTTMVRFYGLGEADPSHHDPRKWRFYAFALLLFTCALFSKTVTCSLPVALIIVLWWQRGRLKISELLPLIPFFALGAAMGLLTAWMEKHFVRAQGVDWTLSPLDRCLLAGRAVWFYLAKLACPAGLTFIYPRWKIDAGAWWQYLYPLALTLLFVMLWLGRRRLGRAPLAALAFFVVTLFPALGFVDVYPMRYSFVADHFQYLAMLGPIALAGTLLSLALNSLSRAHRPQGSAALAVLILLLGALTWSQGDNYKDVQTLWTNNLARNPQSAIALNNLGLLLVNQGGDHREAQGLFERALAVNPRFAEAHLNLANCLAEQNLTAEALAHDTEAQRLDPGDARAPFNIGNIMLGLGKWEEAIAAYQQALKVNAGMVEAHINLGTVLEEHHRYAEALEHFYTLRRLLPGDPMPTCRLAWLLAAAPDAKLRNGAEAIALAEAACRGDASDPHHFETLAAAYAEAGRFDEAIQAAQKALGMARDARNADQVKEISFQLTLYQARQPYRIGPAAPQPN